MGKLLPPRLIQPSERLVRMHQGLNWLLCFKFWRLSSNSLRQRRLLLCWCVNLLRQLPCRDVQCGFRIPVSCYCSRDVLHCRKSHPVPPGNIHQHRWRYNMHWLHRWYLQHRHRECLHCSLCSVLSWNLYKFIKWLTQLHTVWCWLLQSQQWCNGLHCLSDWKVLQCSRSKRLYLMHKWKQLHQCHWCYHLHSLLHNMSYWKADPITVQSF